MTDFATTSRGDRVAYDRYGEGPGLVFVAGAGPFRAIDPWTTETAERAAKAGLTTVVFDRLGRGESPAEGALDLDRELAAVATMIEVAGGSAVLCGHSSGCTIALRAAAAGLPVTGLVLWEAPVATPADETREWAEEFIRLIDAGDTEAAQRQYMKDMPPEWLAEVEKSPEWPMIAAGAVAMRADAESLIWATAALESDGLGAITVPVLTTYGTTTFPEMPAGAKLLVEALPDATERELPGADHSWEPEPMATALVDFTVGTVGGNEPRHPATGPLA